MRIEAIEPPQTTADLVVERIASVIKSRKLAAGARLPGEHELVEQLQVSRPILREALARLQSMGLVDIQRGRGTFVGSATSLANCVRLLRSAVAISPQELLSYAELRSAIEVQAARQAAERATDDDLAELSGILKKLDRDDLPYPQALDLDAHGTQGAGRGEHVLPLQEPLDPALAHRHGRQHQRPVGNRLVARHAHRTGKSAVRRRPQQHE